jgi:replicative DNA helicase
MLYRKEYYDAEKRENDDDGDSSVENVVNEVDVIIAKNRHGPTNTVKLVWDSEHTLFVGIERLQHGM